MLGYADRRLDFHACSTVDAQSIGDPDAGDAQTIVKSAGGDIGPSVFQYVSLPDAAAAAEVAARCVCVRAAFEVWASKPECLPVEASLTHESHTRLGAIFSPFSHTHSFRIPIARLLFSQIPEQGGAAAQWALLAKHLEEEANPFLPYFVPYIRHNSHFPYTRHASSPPPCTTNPFSPDTSQSPLFPYVHHNPQLFLPSSSRRTRARSSGCSPRSDRRAGARSFTALVARSRTRSPTSARCSISSRPSSTSCEARLSSRGRDRRLRSSRRTARALPHTLRQHVSPSTPNPTRAPNTHPQHASSTRILNTHPQHTPNTEHTTSTHPTHDQHTTNTQPTHNQHTTNTQPTTQQPPSQHTP